MSISGLELDKSKWPTVEDLGKATGLNLNYLFVKNMKCSNCLGERGWHKDENHILCSSCNKLISEMLLSYKNFLVHVQLTPGGYKVNHFIRFFEYKWYREKSSENK